MFGIDVQKHISPAVLAEPEMHFERGLVVQARMADEECAQTARPRFGRTTLPNSSGAPCAMQNRFTVSGPKTTRKEARGAASRESADGTRRRRASDRDRARRRVPHWRSDRGRPKAESRKCGQSARRATGTATTHRFAAIAKFAPSCQRTR